MTNSIIKYFFLIFAFFSLGSCGGSGSSSATSAVTGPKYIFYTAASFDGNLGGVSGADSLCMSDANYPGSGTYKAIIAGGGRSASPTPTDWVLYANIEYVRLVDDVTIGTTNASRTFDFPLDASIGDVGLYAWTGLTGTWATGAGTCSSWASNAAGFASTAFISQTASNGIGGGAVGDCSTGGTVRLLCAEQ